MPKILVLDVETMPKVALVWRFFKENISPDQVLKHGHIASFAGKWLDSTAIMYEDNRKEDDTKIIKSLFKLLDEADIVVAHNGARFDLPQIRGRGLVQGLLPPSPVKIIDTYKIAKREFGFESNSLKYLSEVLKCKVKKGGHKKFPGFELWLECLRNNEAAWQEMKEYNIDDILTLEEVYLKMRPWDTSHPNITVYNEEQTEVACPKCGSFHVHRRGYAYTNVGKFSRFVCLDCGGWGRSRYTENKKNENIIINQVQ
jgi:predicted RNA-binding Zn-ribbon protein involved in translation (DUF1610 family)